MVKKTLGVLMYKLFLVVFRLAGICLIYTCLMQNMRSFAGEKSTNISSNFPQTSTPIPQEGL